MKENNLLRIYIIIVIYILLSGSLFNFKVAQFSVDKYTVIEWNDDQDHIHILLKAQPNSELSKFINAYKSASSRLIKKEYPEIREKLWKEYFWSRSFCLITTGGVTIDVIREYIESQGDTHEKKHSL